MPDPIALAVPGFFVLIAIELVWAKKRKVRVYRFSDAVNTSSGCERLSGTKEVVRVDGRSSKPSNTCSLII